MTIRWKGEWQSSFPVPCQLRSMIFICIRFDIKGYQDLHPNSKYDLKLQLWLLVLAGLASWFLILVSCLLSLDSCFFVPIALNSKFKVFRNFSLYSIFSTFSKEDFPFFLLLFVFFLHPFFIEKAICYSSNGFKAKLFAFFLTWEISLRWISLIRDNPFQQVFQHSTWDGRRKKMNKGRQKRKKKEIQRGNKKVMVHFKRQNNMMKLKVTIQISLNKCVSQFINI